MEEDRKMEEKEIRERLKKKKKEIVEQIEINNNSIKKVLNGEIKTSASMENCCDSMIQNKTKFKDRSLALAKCLLNVGYALERLKAGTYGFCQDCGRPIEEKRLLANPEARRCLHCQEVNI